MSPVSCRALVFKGLSKVRVFSLCLPDGPVLVLPLGGARLRHGRHSSALPPEQLLQGPGLSAVSLNLCLPCFQTPEACSVPPTPQGQHELRAGPCHLLSLPFLPVSCIPPPSAHPATQIRRLSAQSLGLCPLPRSGCPESFGRNWSHAGNWAASRWSGWLPRCLWTNWMSLARWEEKVSWEV